MAHGQIVLLAILIERIIDSTLLLSCIFIFHYNLLFNFGISPQIIMGFIVISILGLAAAIFGTYPESKYLHLKIQIEYLWKKNRTKIILISTGVWFCYIVSGFLTAFALSLDFREWLTWNVSSFRLFDFGSKEFKFDQPFNIIFVFGFLLLGFVASFLGHKSNRVINFFTGSEADSFNRIRASSNPKGKISRILFLESPVETYLRKSQTLEIIGQEFRGGSGAMIFSLKSNPKKIRKIGFGHHRNRIQSQFRYLEQFKDKWQFPGVENLTMSESSFSYDMDFISSACSMHSFLSTLNDRAQIEEQMQKLFHFIEVGNTTVGQLAKSEYWNRQNIFWNIKLRKCLDEVFLRVPQLFVSPQISINGKIYCNLGDIFTQVMSLSIFSPKILEISNPHGDSTLSNLLYQIETNKIVSIDPNPEQILQNSTVDHGKVLQSLLMKYEDTLDASLIPDIDLSSITYKPVENEAIERAGHMYLDLLHFRPELQKASEIMCFASMIRLLPYRLNQDIKTAPIFIAQTIELGNTLVEKYS